MQEVGASDGEEEEEGRKEEGQEEEVQEEEGGDVPSGSDKLYAMQGLEGQILEEDPLPHVDAPRLSTKPLNSF